MIEYHVGQAVVYSVADDEKYWSVDEVGDDGTLTLRKHTGETQQAKQDDPALRPATRWERFWHRHSFPQPIVP